MSVMNTMRGQRISGFMASVLILALAAIGVMWFAGDASAQANPLYSYSVKFVCGKAGDFGERPIVRPGMYATEINIHNYNWEDVSIRKHVLVLVRDGEAVGREPKYVKVSGEDGIGLPPETATMDDCQRIAEITGIDTSVLTIGYLHLIATRDVAVDAVYTAGGFDEAGPSIEVERVEANRLAQ